MDTCIFCKIAAKEIPSDIVYEDDNTLAFLDNKPTTSGHTLVIPKKHVVNMFDVDDETLCATMRTTRKLAPAVRDAIGAKGAHVNSNNGAAAGQVIFHLHFHIVPRHDRSEFEFWPHQDSSKIDPATLATAIRAKLAEA